MGEVGLAFTGAANALSLDTLNVLLRYQRLAASLLLNLGDLILWIGLTAGTPFDKAPADTLEFLRRLGSTADYPDRRARSGLFASEPVSIAEPAGVHTCAGHSAAANYPR